MSAHPWRDYERVQAERPVHKRTPKPLLTSKQARSAAEFLAPLFDDFPADSRLDNEEYISIDGHSVMLVNIPLIRH